MSIPTRLKFGPKSLEIRPISVGIKAPPSEIGIPPPGKLSGIKLKMLPQDNQYMEYMKSTKETWKLLRDPQNIV